MTQQSHFLVFREIKIYVHTKTCTQRFTATLFTITQNWMNVCLVVWNVGNTYV